MNPLHTVALAAQGQAPQAEGNPMTMILMFAAIGLVFYFLILRPQRQQQQQAQSMRDSIKRGDQVKSIGGIYGTVTGVDEAKGTVRVRVDRNVELEFDRSAIATVVTKDGSAPGGSAASK